MLTEQEKSELTPINFLAHTLMREEGEKTNTAQPLSWISNYAM